MSTEYDSWVASLTIVGDEALTPEDLDEAEGRRAYWRDYRRNRYQTDPEYREKIKARQREWGRRNREHKRQYAREWMRQKRAQDRAGRPVRPRRVPVAYEVGSLHDLRCQGPTRATGCRCRKVTVARLVTP